MNEQEQRIAIAEACGWRWYRQPASGPWAKRPMRSLYHPELMKLQEKPMDLADMTERECNPMFIWREGLVSDYLHDLNAIHVAVMAECEKRGYEFQAALDYELQCVIQRRRTSLNREQIGFWMNWATAAQRAEAFLRTIGKWRND